MALGWVRPIKSSTVGAISASTPSRKESCVFCPGRFSEPTSPALDWWCGQYGLPGEGILHHLAIAMVGGDEQGAALREHCLAKTAQAGIDRLHGANGGVKIASMADHIGIGVIDHDEIEAT